jgi:putative nucleotidyltransferase with HDIG domain
LAVEAVMRALAKYFKEDEETWGIAGLLHDADYEQTKETPQEHTKKVLSWLREYDTGDEVKNAILAHGWGYVDGNPEPKNNIEWSLYCCDELTGFIVAVALTRPTKQLADVTLESIKRKWKEKSFAAGVDRNQIQECEGRLKIPLDDFIQIALTSMQKIAEELGL